MKFSPFKTRTKHPRSAFSLVEVVLAIGIVGFAAVPVMCMIGGSLKTFHDAVQSTVSREIVSQLASSAQQARKADLQAKSFEKFYMDAEGKPVKADSPLLIYTSTMTVQPATDLWQSDSLFRISIVVKSQGGDQMHSTNLHVSPEN